MMRTRLFVFALAGTAVAWQFTELAAAARCSYEARYPSAIGPHTFLLATATRASVKAPVDSPYYYREIMVPAQVMSVKDVAGYRSEAIRRGLRATGGKAVFVRYGVSMSCGPLHAPDGDFDSVGVNGLYVGLPRPTDRWVDGRPTFDILKASHFPLPQRLSNSRGHAVFTRVDATPTMTAAELFSMYRALWSESVTVGDTTVEPRIRRWIARNPRLARKQPAARVAADMVEAVTYARILANRIPYGGTFAVTLVVPGVDSLVMYTRTSSRTRVWRADAIRDSSTGIIVGLTPHSFAIDMQRADTLKGYPRLPMRIGTCSPTVMLVDHLPIVPGADSSWSTVIGPLGFLECAELRSPLAELTTREARRAFDPGLTPLTFRRHADGRVTFEAHATREGTPGIIVRGERISGETFGPPWDCYGPSACR